MAKRQRKKWNYTKMTKYDYSVRNFLESVKKNNSQFISFIFTVAATDRDSGVNGELEYSVSNDHFAIETVKIGNQYIGRMSIAKWVLMEGPNIW